MHHFKHFASLLIDNNLNIKEMKSSNSCRDTTNQQSNSTGSCCDSATTTATNNDSACDCGADVANEAEIRTENLNIKMDGKDIVVIPEDKNLVDVARRNKISLPAPCYLNGRKTGCCNGCVVDIESEEKFACGLAPKEGMNVIVNTPKLKALRKVRLKEYQKGLKSGNPTPCSVEEKSGGCS